MVTETNIIEIIKSRRYFAKAFKALLTKRQRLQMKEKSRYLYIDPDKKESPLARTFTLRSGDADPEVADYTDGFYSSESSLDTARVS